VGAQDEAEGGACVGVCGCAERGAWVASDHEG
jgi:hypothetical protein